MDAPNGRNYEMNTNQHTNKYLMSDQDIVRFDTMCMNLQKGRTD